jgi:hypothetical protein
MKTNFNSLTSKDIKLHGSFQCLSGPLYVAVFPSNRLYNVKGATKETDGGGGENGNVM